MKNRYYLYSHGELLRQDNSLVLIDSKNNKTYLPVNQIEQINAFSQITLNKNTISILNDNYISVNFFSYYGKYLGSFIPNFPKFGKVIVKQVMCLNDDIKRNYVAKEITYSSIYNCLALLKYYHKKYAILNSEINELSEVLKNIKNCELKKYDELMIYEAKAKQIYYSSFSEIIRNNDFSFSKRTKNPPKDEVNALMSYGYAILYSLIANKIHRSSLHISFPFIHSNARRKEGLQFDIADIFKPVLIDRLIFRMINKKQILKTHFFEYKDGIYLNKEGAKIFIEEIENNLKSTIKTNLSKNNLSYNQIISKEIHKLSNHIKEKERYVGFKMGW